MRRGFAFVALSAISIVPVYSQAHEHAPVLQIGREAIKEGKGATHEKAEMEFVRAFHKAKFPGHYIALTSMSGPGEVWFISPYPSFATSEQYQKETEKEPLKSEIEMAEEHDGAVRESSRSMWAVYRKDLSYRPGKFDPAKARVISVGTFRVKLGKDEDFMNGAKMYIGANEKANNDVPFLCYQVVAGAPNGTYLFFSAMESLKTMDETPARQKAMMEAMGSENFAQFSKGTGDVFQFMDENLFAVNPRMSYAPKEMEDADPAFWKPKPVAKKAAEAAPKKEEKLAQ